MSIFELDRELTSVMAMNNRIAEIVTDSRTQGTQPIGDGDGMSDEDSQDTRATYRVLQVLLGFATLRIS